jgi:hypothetical protein
MAEKDQQKQPGQIKSYLDEDETDDDKKFNAY